MALRFFFSLFFFLSSSFSFADDNSSSIVSQLQTLRRSVIPPLKVPNRKMIQNSDGTFSYANQTTTDVSSPNETSSIEDLSENDFSIISPGKYKNLNINPLYSDSMVKLYSHGALVEIKLFPNGMSMTHFLGKNIVTFSDLDSDDPTASKFLIYCSVDKITDAKECILSDDNIHYYKKSDKPSFLILGDDMDYLRPSYLRVDKNKAFKSNRLGFSRPTLDSVLNEMISGQNVYLRYHKKFREPSYDSESSLKGFSSAYKTLNILYSSLK